MNSYLKIATLLAATGIAAGCTEELNTPVADDELQSMESDYVAFGMVSFITANGVREGRVEADTAYVFEETGLANLHQMEIVFYEEETGRQQATVSGVAGEWNRETNRMVARGDVVLFLHADSSTIESQEIYYDPALGSVWSDSTTVRTMKDGTVTSGTAFESDMSFENIRIANARGGIRRVF
ncbi:MAG: LPS export ABC transporter periplasmic protein LptC [Gemmatimonadetes bacterium]|nr:LPS export ABC transporter periplasmic protein LptC [Gemmatimonadota bacterium]NNL29788.1 LPS export ABC transporter periplasmic protein LptC [Gemmatimonadota bacterium]